MLSRDAYTARMEAQFMAWASQEARPASPPAAGTLAAQGAQDFATGACVGCHTIPGIPGANGQVGPNLMGVASRPKIAGGAVPSPICRYRESGTDLARAGKDHGTSVAKDRQ